MPSPSHNPGQQEPPLQPPSPIMPPPSYNSEQRQPPVQLPYPPPYRIETFDIEVGVKECQRCNSRATLLQILNGILLSGIIFIVTLVVAAAFGYYLYFKFRPSHGH
jgi:hypothetical protein